MEKLVIYARTDNQSDHSKDKSSSKAEEFKRNLVMIRYLELLSCPGTGAGAGVAKALVAGVEYPLLSPESLAVDIDDIEDRLAAILSLLVSLVAFGSTG